MNTDAFQRLPPVALNTKLSFVDAGFDVVLTRYVIKHDRKHGGRRYPWAETRRDLCPGSVPSMFAARLNGLVAQGSSLTCGLSST